ncbi:P-loop NTPase fold protein [Nocardia sp. alder85J]|uniref:P-loop NTPase fold protein n=1 Tax=Nocardia sp. alder85J TaxID=2862949 RepID=UPI001CD5342C|nr:P-loop NTPase fold protein [Nocardia sp. alder85J]MCX4093610.1 P-loop NTPase fold protein [Nocardia sp. alder85J]
MVRAESSSLRSQNLTVRELSRPSTLPLAIGLFGQWGEGKSQFLELVRAQVPVAARSPLGFRYVRQVSFNAWHYAETDLWASLVAVLFHQLADPIDDSDPIPRQMAQLDAELIARRKLDPQITAIRERITDLEHRADRLRGWRAELATWRRVLFGYTKQVAGEVTEPLAEKIDAAAPRTWRNQIRAITGLRVQAGWLRGTIQLLVVVAAVVGALRAQDWLHASGALGGGAGVILVVQWIYLHTRDYTAAIRDLLEAVNTDRERRADELDDRLDQSRARLQELLREKRDLTAAGRLAGLVTDRSADGSYRQNLGLMTRIREDFEAMSALLLDAAARRPDPDPGDESGTTPMEVDELPAIDWIIVYIDDLDRCPPARVVQLLEAVHLMLALPLFVVVVAVDPRWMLRAIAVHYHDMLTTGPTPRPSTARGHRWWTPTATVTGLPPQLSTWTRSSRSPSPCHPWTTPATAP